MTRHLTYVLALAAAALALTAAPVAAAAPGATPVFAGYWRDFLAHWSGKLEQQNSIIVFALGLGAVSLLIITRGKWKK